MRMARHLAMCIATWLVPVPVGKSRMFGISDYLLVSVNELRESYNGSNINTFQSCSPLGREWNATSDGFHLGQFERIGFSSRFWICGHLLRSRGVEE